MNSNILLAVDAAAGQPHPDASAAVQMARELVRDSADHVVVLYVREFSFLRIARMVADHGGTAGRHAVDGIVARLREAGVHASGLIREAEAGHVARTILDAAHDVDARVIIVGSGSPARLPGLVLGNVATHVLHQATLPVLIVPAQGWPPTVTTGATPTPAGSTSTAISASC
ncbi:MAG: universal stress protein [Actinomycetota bacterium]|nr:universal stress protein [Actinomycetota bacterium]